MKTKRQLAVELCKREGKKSQVAIGNMMEVLSRLEELFAEERVRIKGLGQCLTSQSAELAMSSRVTLIARKILKIKEKQEKAKPIRPYAKETK